MRVGFYPCCSCDIEQPLELLRGFVDVVVFCDIDAKVRHYINKFRAAPDGPSARFERGDAREVIEGLERIDVLFYRRDSSGEGGSGLLVLGHIFLRPLLKKLPADGALIITDGSNSRGNNFKKMCKAGLSLDGWLLKAAEVQPYKEEHDLWIIEVRKGPEAESG